MIVALAFQAGTAIWWASGIERRMDGALGEVARVDGDNDTQAAQIEALRGTTQNLALTAAAVNTQLGGLTQSLGEIKAEQRQIYELLRQMNGNYEVRP